MLNSMKQRCELFVENRDKMKDNFRWNNSMLYPLCACLYTEKGLKIDDEKIKFSKKLIKNNTTIFSNFRNISFLVLATMLSLDKAPESKFRKVLDAYEKLRNEFHSSQYLPLSAFVMADMVETYDFEKTVKKSKEIYQRMKKEHPFLTSSEDCGFAVRFALSDLSVDSAILEMEKCYSLLKNKFFLKNSVQSLSHTLALGNENADIKCDKFVKVFNQLKDNNCKFGIGVELAVLGVLVLSTDNTERIANDIIEINEYLLSSKGFGAFGTGKRQRLMYCAILAEQEYQKLRANNIMDITSINSVTNIIIAQYIAISAAVAASAAGSAGS